jgi:uncharacterized membrane protein YeaQ/YmgE (transglycosylase-associated protein family)
MGMASVIVVGLIAGLTGRAVMPGKDSMGWIMTIVLGIFGSFVGGFLVNLGLNRNADAGPSGFQSARIVGSVVGAVVVLGIWRVVRGRMV